MVREEVHEYMRTTSSTTRQPVPQSYKQLHLKEEFTTTTPTTPYAGITSLQAEYTPVATLKDKTFSFNQKLLLIYSPLNKFQRYGTSNTGVRSMPTDSYYQLVQVLVR